MRESFVIHSEYIEDLPEEYKDRFLMMVYDYGIHEIVPELDSLEKSLWIKIQRRIDIDRESYQKKLDYLKEYRKNKKNGANSSQGSESSQKFAEFSNIPTISLSDNDIDSVNDIDNVFVNDIDNDIDNDIEIDTVNDIDISSSKTPSAHSPSTTNYSKIIFELFRDANLPCARNNEISFLQTDFTNAMNHLHKTPEFAHIHSDDVIGAVKNYIEVLLNPDCYVSTKMNFLQFVKSKLFYNLLPANYDLNNYLHFDAVKSDKKSDDDKFKDYDKKYISSPCKKCNGKRIFLNPNINQWICDDCFAMYPFSSYKGD